MLANSATDTKTFLTVAILSVMTIGGDAADPGTAAGFDLTSSTTSIFPTPPISTTTTPTTTNAVTTDSTGTWTITINGMEITETPLLPIPTPPHTCVNGQLMCHVTDSASVKTLKSINGLHHARSCSHALASYGWVPWDCGMASVYNSSVSRVGTGSQTEVQTNTRDTQWLALQGTGAAESPNSAVAGKAAFEEGKILWVAGLSLSLVFGVAAVFL